MIINFLNFVNSSVNGPKKCSESSYQHPRQSNQGRFSVYVIKIANPSGLPLYTVYGIINSTLYTIYRN